jgi:hypothetical protein
MSSDLDLTASRGRRGGLTARRRRRDFGVSGDHNKVVPMVFESSGSDDGVQDEMAKMMVCSTRCCASCNSEETQL